MNISLSPFAPKHLVVRDGFGRPVIMRQYYTHPKDLPILIPQNQVPEGEGIGYVSVDYGLHL